ncbi:SMC-Scp complex subunit ScpB (plasmid) [Agrobacterium vitis]|uniref:SMC-Scp complex subunit ScpB n=1 Tax=Agrobacterium vitis TaxID=373 RepID=UPI0012E6F3DC|nr:SMC-Scp complex subunit ScpB [Agrobacterium vitis]MVA27266.1 segregation and condensation protein B [Agrobacterium vitis]
MTEFTAAKSSRRRASAADEHLYDRELDQFPPEMRWREWMLRVEAVIFASAEPVSRETLARMVGKDCSIDLLVDDLREDLSSRPYELVSVAGARGGTAALSDFEAMVLMAVGYFQPITRGELSKIFGKEVSRNTIGALRGAGFIGSGPRSPTPGAPYTYVTTQHFLSAFEMETLRDLPNIEALEDAGLLSRDSLPDVVEALKDLEEEETYDQ